MEKVISIIVPVYGVEKYLDQCVSSILSQTYTALEVILVDDGSPDACPAMCDAWAEKDGRVRVIHQENAGLSGARNRGLDCATGEYILFVDSDDYLMPELCRTALEAIGDADVAVFGYHRFRDGDGKILSTRTHAPGIVTGREALGLLMEKKIDSYAWNKLYKRELFAGIRYPVGRAWEDVGTTYRIFCAAQTVSLCGDVLCWYRQRAGSITGQMSVKTCQDIFAMRLARYEDIRADEPEFAALGLRELADAAIYAYELSLYKTVDADELQAAVGFLERERQVVLPLYRGNVRTLFYKNRKLYDRLIRLRHRIGKLVRGR